jgi:hypothetical protein
VTGRVTRQSRQRLLKCSSAGARPRSRAVPAGTRSVRTLDGGPARRRPARRLPATHIGTNSTRYSCRFDGDNSTNLAASAQGIGLMLGTRAYLISYDLMFLKSEGWVNRITTLAPYLAKR